MAIDPDGLDHEKAVLGRYSKGAKQCEQSLCCAVEYDAKLLEALPTEVVERDYGCGDPTKYVEPGESVLDLGSGSGKACFIASQIVGERGRVIGIDMNDDMLALARRAAPRVAERIGYANVEFRKARIQELEGVVEDESIDVVLSNCVLNLVRPEDKRRLFRELYRVLKVGGRAVISDIVCDREVPEALTRDPELWSGCVSGAFREDGFLRAFEDAGFSEAAFKERAPEPWRTIEGIEFRSATVVAFRGAPKAARASGCC